MNTIVFTRYLYVKDEVELALVTSLLTRNERSLFWAYELYYSGFKDDLFCLLWRIYYDFFASLHPSFWEYMIKKEKEIDVVKAIACIIQNLLIRKCNLDGFLVRKIHGQKSEDIKEDLVKWLKEKDVDSLSIYILHQCNLCNLESTLLTVLNYFEVTPKQTLTYQKKWTKAILYPKIDPRTHLLSTILSILSAQSGLVLGRNLYVISDSANLDRFKTVLANPLRADKILQHVCIYSIDPDDCLSLFLLKRDIVDVSLTHAYYYHWEYYASFSPLWRERLATCRGYVVNETKRIAFMEESEDSDDNQQRFYDQYGYDPDEQSTETQRKNIQDIRTIKTWASFCDEYKTKGIYHPSIVSQWTKINYN